LGTSPDAGGLPDDLSPCQYSPAFACGIAPLEQYHDLELLVLHPILQFDQLVLKAEQLTEIDTAFKGLNGHFGHAIGDEIVQPLLLDLHFQLFIEAVGNLRLDAVEMIVVEHGAISLRGGNSTRKQPPPGQSKGNLRQETEASIDDKGGLAAPVGA
jgi:hypothetical protein